MTKREQAKELLSQYIEADNRSKLSYWDKAMCLFEWKQGDLFKQVWGNESWPEFLLEIKAPSSSASQKVICWGFYIVKHNFTIEQLGGLDTSCLYQLARKFPEAKKQEIEKWLKRLSELPREDFLVEISGKDCSHQHTHKEREEVEKCDDCGRNLPKRKKK